MKKHFLPTSTLAIIFSVAFLTTPAFAEDNWKFEVVPYAWLAGIDGDVSVGSREAEVDIGFDDLLDATDLGGSLLTVSQYKQWVLWTQVDYFSLDTDELDDAPARSNLQSDALFATAAFGYQFQSFGESTIDVLAGVRYLNLENELAFEGLGSASRTKDIVDGIFMLRPSVQLTSWLRFNPTMSVGAGDSDLTYELQPQFQFQITDAVVARVGYRRLYYDVKGDRGEFDAAFHGFILGLGVTF